MKKIVALLMSVLPATSFAGFHVVDESAKQTATEQSVPASDLAAADVNQAGAVLAASKPTAFGLVAVNYIGEPSDDIEVRKGFGRDMKLTEALKQIAPQGWHAYLKEEVVGKFDKNRLVTWRGGRKWVEVLDILATDQALSMDVDWTKRQIYVGEKNFSFEKALAGKVVTPGKVFWVAKKGSSLRDSVTEWAQAAGWDVSWVPQDLDYPIIGTLTYEGTFENAVMGIFRAYEGAERPMLVDGNPRQKLIVVTEKNK